MVLIKNIDNDCADCNNPFFIRIILFIYYVFICVYLLVCVFDLD